ncbi:protein FAR-RED ELONGATED HYPOCOTYL 3-like [Spinacia oleracea]|uniref:Protein FAR-RED ELONGATED HYPOCOTYL 3-like n=1 Tax=Spinacia oleracea TaxID=3562 RepID=A0ABM3QVS9_SPIOL|nr:protein FAR-RED ELONGATED HYPOCOTYL 3-like [Spinacia oleracea]
MLIDYALFGDVVAFDTTFGTNKEHRPLGVFVGFNHFRETTVFGAALLYDETIESFKWLFETFLATHCNKEPKTIFTDQDIAMGKAIAEVMPNVWHGLCTWHITENATKHLLCDGLEVLRAFKACMYEYKEEAEFEEAFSALRGKVSKGTWLDSIYAVKEKWAECYMTNVFSLGMRSTQLSESFNKDLKDYLKCTMDIMRFFKQFERVLGLKRQNEINNEFDSKEKLPRIKMRRTPLLRQVGQIYTSNIFEAFQDEYEWSTAAIIKPPVEGQLTNEYRVVISDPENDSSINKEYQVFGDPLIETVSCSCKMFERLGLLCAHALKVLDTMNIKLIPRKYILKHWTREAKAETVQDTSGRTILEDPRLDATRRYKALCQKFVKVASGASNFIESSSLLEKGLNNLSVEVDKLVLSLKRERGETPLLSEGTAREQQGSTPTNVPNNVTLKPKEGRKGGKRRKSWTENFHDKDSQGSTDQRKSRKKKMSNHSNTENTPPQQGEDRRIVPQHIVALGNNYQNLQVPNNSFTQLLLGEHNRSQDPSYFDSWPGIPFPSQVCDVIHLIRWIGLAVERSFCWQILKKQLSPKSILSLED